MKSKRRKIFYVALSILIAATIWFYVNNKESVTVYVHDVPIEFLNEDTSLADKGLMRISGDEDITVDLKLQMPRNVVYDFDTSELRLVSDLSTITYAGKQSVSYTILYPSKVSSSSDMSVRLVLYSSRERPLPLFDTWPILHSTSSG